MRSIFGKRGGRVAPAPLGLSNESGRPGGRGAMACASYWGLSSATAWATSTSPSSTPTSTSASAAARSTVKMVPRTPATARSVETSNLESEPAASLVTLAQSEPMRSLAEKAVEPCSPKRASSSWRREPSPRAITLSSVRVTARFPPAATSSTSPTSTASPTFNATGAAPFGWRVAPPSNSETVPAPARAEDEARKTETARARRMRCPTPGPGKGFTALDILRLAQQDLQFPDAPGHVVALQGAELLRQQVPRGALLDRGQVLQLDLQW